MKSLPKRKKLMARYTLVSVGLLVVGVATFYALRPADKPYVAGERIEGITNSLDRGVPPDVPKVRFVDVAASAGIPFQHFHGQRTSQLPEDMGSGLVWGDFDGDGNIDLYVCNIAAPLTASDEERKNSPASNRLYRNQGDGTFSDVTVDSGTGFKGTAMAAAWGDYDGDRDLDLLVTSYGPVVLYRNDGDGTFRDVTESAGLSLLQGFWAGVSWGDYDRDGDLDAYVCGYVKYDFDPADTTRSTTQYSAVVPFTLNPSSYAPERNLLLRNLGNGRFSEVGASAGVDNPSGRSLTATWCDFDEDGWLDLYVANDISDNVMFRNLGNGRFEDISHNAWVADYRGAMGLAVGDWDNDRDFDIFVSHWLAQENALLNNLIYAFDHPVEKAEKLLFMDIADQNGLGQIALDYIGWATGFFDYDNDGLQDLYVINGSTFQDREDPRRLLPMRSLLFWNRGEEDGFFEVGEVAGEYFQTPRVGRGGAVADFDNDGDLDLAVVNHGSALALLRNEGETGNHWLRVRLRVGGKNHFGYGARIEVVTAGGRQIRMLGSQPSYLSQDAPEAHFGLGRDQVVDEVLVVLPDGTVMERRTVQVNQTLTIEGP